VVAAVVWPRPRVDENWALCNANLRILGSAMSLYCNENRGRYPDTLGQMMVDEDISSAAFVCSRDW